MTIEQLEKRKQELLQGQAQAVANSNAFSGAIQEINFWLNELKKKEISSESSPVSS
jgi:hypothetical protein